MLCLLANGQGVDHKGPVPESTATLGCHRFISGGTYWIRRALCWASSSLVSVPVHTSWLIVAGSRSRPCRCQMSGSIQRGGSCLGLFIYDLPGFPLHDEIIRGHRLGSDVVSRLEQHDIKKPSALSIPESPLVCSNCLVPCFLNFHTDTDAH